MTLSCLGKRQVWDPGIAIIPQCKCYYREKLKLKLTLIKKSYTYGTAVPLKFSIANAELLGNLL